MLADYILPSAVNDIEDIIAYFRSRKALQAGRRFLTSLEASIQQVAEMPEIGATWESPYPELAGVRTWKVKSFESYVIYYRPLQRRLEIMRVLHGSRDAMPLLLNVISTN
jgi:toxin ParE1/3/4